MDNQNNIIYYREIFRKAEKYYYLQVEFLSLCCSGRNEIWQVHRSKFR